jgi:hypothetical protein
MPEDPTEDIEAWLGGQSIDKLKKSIKRADTAKKRGAPGYSAARRQRTQWTPEDDAKFADLFHDRRNEDRRDRPA